MHCWGWSTKSSELRTYTEQKKKCTLISTGNFIILQTAQRSCSVWVKWAIARESSFVTQKFIVAFYSVQQTVKCIKVNDGCDKPCAPCTTRYPRGINGLSWLIRACGISSQSSWITRHNCALVSGSRELIWQSVRFLTEARWGTGRWLR